MEVDTYDSSSPITFNFFENISNPNNSTDKVMQSQSAYSKINKTIYLFIHNITCILVNNFLKAFPSQEKVNA